jgi:uncharacterized protein (TIGR00730 family)
VYRETAARLGREMGAAGIGLVYGGGHVGLMGTVADAVLGAGGEVTGVMTRALVDAEVAHAGLTTLEVVDTMHERKARMTELSDGVIALPGGFGTLDETFEVLTWNQLGITARPVVFLDVGGYYAELLRFVAGAVEAGFVRPEHGTMAQRATSVAEAIDAASDDADRGGLPKWI